MPDLFSAAGIRTLREAPADAGTGGYALLLRAGYLDRDPRWRPPGERLLADVERIVAEAVARAGAEPHAETVDRPPAGPGLLRDRAVRVVRSDPVRYDLALARLGLDTRTGDDGAVLASVPGAAEPVAVSPDCGWTGEARSVPSPTRPAPLVQPGPLRELDTPDTPTIAALAAAFDVPPAATLKNLLVLAGDEVVAVGVPGDREVDLDRLAAVLGPVRLFTEADFAARPELVRGYVGPQGLGLRYLADRRVGTGTGWVTGANAPGRHARDVVAGRDFAVDAYADLVVVADGDPCPRCGQPLRLERAVVLARPGEFAVSRAVAVIAEQHHDGRGLRWPREVSPYDVQVVPVGRGEQPALARDLAARLDSTGLRVLLDDRDASAGVKLTDAELLGVPWTVVVGRRAPDGVVEVRERATGESTESSLDDVIWAVTR